MTPLIDRVRWTIRRFSLAGPDTRVVVAVSGGSDSTALAHILRELAASGDLLIAGIAHFNHRLRGAADDDERFCVLMAQTLGWPCLTDGEDVRDRARRERRSIETAARAARHAFFERARVLLDAQRVAVGHTRDDQAETFLLRLVRGAGPRGLAAMHPQNGTIIRPLLDCRRSELRGFLDERRAGYVEDETNRDTSIARNRVRMELLPLLEARFNPRIVDVLANEADLLREEWRWVEAVAEELLARVGSAPTTHVWELDRVRLAALTLAEQRVVVRRVMTELSSGRPVGFEHVEAVLRLLEPDAPAGPLSGPGQSVERIGAQIVLTGRRPGFRGRPLREPPVLFRVRAAGSGEVRLPEAGWVVSAELAPGTIASQLSDPARAVVRYDDRDRLEVRNRRPGDRFRPTGLGGRKTLQDFFVDRKVERGRRNRVPVVVDQHDRIVWVAGYGVDEAFRVTEPTEAVVVLRLKLLGGCT